MVSGKPEKKKRKTPVRQTQNTKTEQGILSARGEFFSDAAEKRSHPGYDGYAYPLFPHIKYYPLIGEVVTIITLTSKNHIDDITALEDYYFPPINLCESLGSSPNTVEPVV